MCFVSAKTKAKQASLVKQQKQDAREAKRIAQRQVREQKELDLEARRQRVDTVRSSYGTRSLLGRIE